jgi:hypothetical protein
MIQKLNPLTSNICERLAKLRYVTNLQLLLDLEPIVGGFVPFRDLESLMLVNYG